MLVLREVQNHPVRFRYRLEDVCCRDCFFVSFVVFVVCLGVGVNWYTSFGVSVTSRSATLNLDCAVLWSIVIELMKFSHKIDAFRGVSSLIYTYESRRTAMMCSSPCLNWFSVRTNSMLCYENIFVDLNLSRSSVVFGKYVLYSLPVGKYFECSKAFPCCVVSLTDDSKIFMATNIFQ